jgi:outer membrane lipoprotein-sorting protein
MDKLQRAAMSVQTVSASFVQEKRLAVFDETLVSKGRLALKKPDKLRWEYLEPGPAGFSLNGGKVKRWSEFSGQTESQGAGQDMALKTVAEQLLAWGKVDVERLQAGFEFSLVSSDPIILRLAPKPEALRKLIEFIQITFSPDGRHAQTVELHEKDGDFTRIQYQDVELNKPLDDNAF